MSMVVLLLVLRRPPYDAVRGWCWFRRASVRPPGLTLGGQKRAFGPRGTNRLLGVELHDQLLLDRGVDHLAGRDAVHEHAQLAADDLQPRRHGALADRKSTRLNSSHANISYAVFCLKKTVTLIRRMPSAA